MPYKDPEVAKAFGRRRRTALQATTLRELSQKLKSVPCVDCGGTFPPICMDWDHIDPAEKSGTVSKTYRKSLSAFLKEIEKCEVVCANCHRIRTFERKQFAHTPRKNNDILNKSVESG